jgi:hypothetical protein
MLTPEFVEDETLIESADSCRDKDGCHHLGGMSK